MENESYSGGNTGKKFTVWGRQGWKVYFYFRKLSIGRTIRMIIEYKRNNAVKR